MPGQLRLMHVHAHPDDESSKGAATTARYVAEGVEVLVVTCTGGERGSILNPNMDRPDVLANIADHPPAGDGLARDEILGIGQVWLGFVDSGFPEGDPLPPLPDGCFGLQTVDRAAASLVAAMRTFRPHVVTTYDENGGYPHPDHVMCHNVTVAAFDAAGDARRVPRRTASPGSRSSSTTTTPSTANGRRRCTTRCSRRGLESPYTERLAGWAPDPTHDRRITTRVPCADYFPVRDRALLAHATQIDPEGPWFAVPARGPPEGLAHRGL